MTTDFILDDHVWLMEWRQDDNSCRIGANLQLCQLEEEHKSQDGESGFRSGEHLMGRFQTNGGLKCQNI